MSRCVFFRDFRIDSNAPEARLRRPRPLRLLLPLLLLLLLLRLLLRLRRKQHAMAAPSSFYECATQCRTTLFYTVLKHLHLILAAVHRTTVFAVEKRHTIK